MNIQDFVDEELIFIKLAPKSQKELLEGMFKVAQKNGFVSDDFLSRLLTREEKFPTGLKLGQYNVAIPHTDAECVKKQFIAVATLEVPVPFYLMENNKEQSNVSLVFMLGLNTPHNQLEILKELVCMIQDKQKVSNLVHANSREEALRVLKAPTLSN